MQILTMLYERQAPGVCLKSPAVGYVSHLPIADQIVDFRTAIGRIQILGTTYNLHLPNNFGGRVANVKTEKIQTVEYGQPLFSLLPVQAEVVFGDGTPQTSQANSDENVITIPSPSDGIFYRRPSPEEPAYVEVDDVIKTGQVLGLVEVMKCFSQITFSGPNLPSKAKIVEICSKDAAEVKHQQPLFIIKAV